MITVRVFILVASYELREDDVKRLNATFGI